MASPQVPQGSAPPAAHTPWGGGGGRVWRDSVAPHLSQPHRHTHSTHKQGAEGSVRREATSGSHRPPDSSPRRGPARAVHAPLNGLYLAFGSTFWVSVPRHGCRPVMKKSVLLPGVSTKAGARCLRSSSVLAPGRPRHQR